MQSFLQRRRAGVAAQAQIDRDLEKARQNPVESKANDNLVGESIANANPPAIDGQPSSALEDSIGDATPYDEIEIGNNHDVEDNAEPSVFGTHTQRFKTTETRHSERTALGRILTGIHVRNRHSHEGHGEQVFVVHWEGSADPLNPHNWPTARRVGALLQISLIAIFIGAASGIDATVLPQAAADLNVSEVAESLATGS